MCLNLYFNYLDSVNWYEIPVKSNTIFQLGVLKSKSIMNTELKGGYKGSVKRNFHF